MNQSRLISDAQRKLPYYEGANLSLPKFRKFLGATLSEFSTLTNKSTRTLQRHKFATAEMIKQLQPLLYSISLLAEIAEADEIKRWLHTPLKEWRGRSPMDELTRGNLDGVLSLIERIRAGEGGY